MSDALALLALFIAISTYLSSIRISAIERIRETDDPNYKGKLKQLIYRISLADIPLLIAAALLTVRVLVTAWNAEPRDWLMMSAIFFFTLSAFMLGSYHFQEFVKSKNLSD